jgi:transcriptional regulator with XRE-family HTH domain
MAGRGHPERPVPAGSPGAPVAEYLRELRHAAGVTYRQMAATVPCRHNTLSQTVDGRLTGWAPVETFLRALRAAAPADRTIPPDAEEQARRLWQEARRRAARERRPARASTARPPGTSPVDAKATGVDDNVTAADEKVTAAEDGVIAEPRAAPANDPGPAPSGSAAQTVGVPLPGLRPLLDFVRRRR